MKAILAILSGLVMSSVSFAAGVLTAVFFLIPQPEARPPLQDAGEIWTNQPVRVRPADRDPAGLSPRPFPQLSIEAQAEAEPDAPHETDGVEQLVDTTTTASIAAVQPEAQPDPASNMDAAHVRWCSEQFRSYRPEDNSYTSYSGGSRQCVSPYSATGSGTGGPVQASTEPVQQAMAGAQRSVGYLSPEHVQSCFARYRSYRPEDNSYQPYDGGPRRQCR